MTRLPSAVTAAELARLHILFRQWPCSARLPRQISKAKRRLAWELRQESQALRNQVFKKLRDADAATLARVAQMLEAS